MKQGHFAILFCGLYVICFLELFAEQKRYDMVLEEKQRIEKALLEAIEGTAQELIGVIHNSDAAKKQVIESAFFDTLFVSLGLLEETESQEILKMYLPLLVLVEEDGALFFHMQENSNNGGTELCHVWSDKVLFPAETGVSEEERKENMVKLLEHTVSDFISNHNYIAAQYGLEYSFSVPTFFQNMEAPSEVPTLIAVFQGWPLTASGDVVYENCMDAAVYLQKVERYVVVLPSDLENTVSYYHKDSCPRLEMIPIGKTIGMLTEQDAVQLYGAYSCEKCN